jgi:hypothetical protein
MTDDHDDPFDDISDAPHPGDAFETFKVETPPRCPIDGCNAGITVVLQIDSINIWSLRANGTWEMRHDYQPGMLTGWYEWACEADHNGSSRAHVADHTFLRPIVSHRPEGAW